MANYNPKTPANTPTPIDVEELKRLYYEEGMTQEEVARIMGVGRKVIENTMKRHGLERRKAVKRNQIKENNDTWKGGKTRSKSGYILTRCEGHPRATKQGHYVQEHVLVMEKHLGRYLDYFGRCKKENEVVHHKNHIKDDNRLENLELMTQSDHVKLHNRLRREEKENDTKS